MEKFIELSAADGFVFPVYTAQPTGPVRGAVVVVQEIFGVNAHIRAVADGYAAQGYLALAPSTFHRVQPDVALAYTAGDVTTGVALKARAEALPAPGVLQDLQATIDYASRVGKVGIVGYCWGGLLTWRAACGATGLSAAVPYYGGGMTTPGEMARQPHCPVLAHFADTDASISLDSVNAFTQAHPDVTVCVYPGHHGFNCDQRAAYEAAAAELALTRTLAFFKQHLG